MILFGHKDALVLKVWPFAGRITHWEGISHKDTSVDQTFDELLIHAILDSKQNIDQVRKR